MRTKHLIFVYGTLKRGFTNWQRYLGVAETHGGACFVGCATTVEAFPMVVRPPHMPPTTCAPILMDRPGTGSCILGEVYRVDPAQMPQLDAYEGVPNSYIRLQHLLRDGRRVWVYMHPSAGL